VTVISEFTKKDLLRHINIHPNKIRVIYDPVSPVFQPVLKEFNQHRPVILQFNTGKHKNLERVAEALKSISCHLRIIGKLDNEQQLALQKSEIDYSVVSSITDEEVLDEYRCCDLLVLASTFEGFGLPIVEAQATGRPVVTSNLCSMPEVAGHAACLVDPYDVASIREGILKIINDHSYRAGLVQSGFENVKRFHPAHIAKEYLRIYQEISCNVDD